MIYRISRIKFTFVNKIIKHIESILEDLINCNKLKECYSKYKNFLFYYKDFARFRNTYSYLCIFNSVSQRVSSYIFTFCSVYSAFCDVGLQLKAKFSALIFFVTLKFKRFEVVNLFCRKKHPKSKFQFSNPFIFKNKSNHLIFSYIFTSTYLFQI